MDLAEAHGWSPKIEFWLNAPKLQTDSTESVDPFDCEYNLDVAGTDAYKKLH